MDWRFFSWTLLCLLRSGVEALNVDIPKDLYEFARGDNITLPCNFKPSIAKPPLIIVTWSAEAEAVNAKEKVILTHYSSSSLTDIAPPYEGRASPDIDVVQGKANLKLSSITMADNKVYECRVQIPRDDEGKPVDRAKLVVLVAPSVPICAIEGKAQYGQNINLTCKSEEGSPPPTYKWQGRDVRNTPRVPDPRTTDKDGILSLYNISKDTSGYYICTSSNKIRSAQCNITLAVMPPTMNLGSTGTIIGIVAGVIGLIAIIVIAYCCCRRKKKQQEAAYAMGVREDEYHDKEEAKNGESRHPDGQEDPADLRERREERSEPNYDDRRSDYDDRRSDYDDRRSDYNDRRDRRRDYDDRRSDYDDRRSDYNDRRSDYDDRRSDYDDRRSDYDNRRDRYDDSYNRRDDRGRRDNYDDRRYDEPYDDRESDRPRVPANKPPNKDYDD